MCRLPDISVVGSSDTLDDIVKDGKIGEFIDYIERTDNNDSVSDRLQFKEYLEQPKRLRHSSYNYETDKDNEDKFNDFSIVENDEREKPKDLPNENKSSDFNSKRGINNRKPNMFALASSSTTSALPPSSSHQSRTDDSHRTYRPLIRITSTEDERIEQFLHEEHIDNTHGSNGDILIKSKTTQTFECRVESLSDVDSYGTDSRANTPTFDMNRCESILSDVGSEPIQFECKQPENPNYFYNREDSSSSNKSNVLFERSQSRFSELEYIKGRDDWKDDYQRNEGISEEIDSDNYHHLRRHSEAADTLEYIRGREDWLRNELHRNRCQNSLPRIFEVGEPKMLIQDEIDSDEYHHNFFQHETLRSASIDSNTGQANKSSTQIVDYDDDGQFVASSVDEKVYNKKVPANLNDANRKSSEWNDDDGIELESNNDSSIVVASANVMGDKNNDEINEINVVIEDLITPDVVNNEDFEIMVWNLTPEPQKNNPFILISEATDDDSHGTSIDLNQNQSIDKLHQESIQISITTDDAEIIGNSLSQCNDTQDVNKINTSKESLCTEIQNGTNTRQRSQSESEKWPIEPEIMKETTLQPLRNIRAKSEATGTDLLKLSEQKPRRTISFENVDDLIQDVSNGPWFHK